jgi:hypothetical protein
VFEVSFSVTRKMPPLQHGLLSVSQLQCLPRQQRCYGVLREIGGFLMLGFHSKWSTLRGLGSVFFIKRHGDGML